MTRPADENDRIRSYLQAQAAKLTVPELMEKVRSDSEQLRAAAEAGGSVDYLRQPADGEWCVNEVMNHVHGSCVGINAGILAAALEGGRPGPVADAILRTSEAREPLAWFELIRSERDATFAGLSGVSGDENLDVRWSHPFFGELNWREWLLFLRLHDLDHARQVQGIVESLSGTA